MAAGLANLPTGLDNHQSFHATRADMLRRLSRLPEAREAYDRALELTRNQADRLLLERNRDALDAHTRRRRSGTSAPPDPPR